MKKKKRHSRRHLRIIILSVAIVVVFLSILSFQVFKAPIVEYLYKHRYFADAFDRVGEDSGTQPVILNFDFSLRDMEYFTSFPEKTSFEAGKRQIVELNVFGQNYTVDLLPFTSYFKSIKLNKKKNSFRVHFPPGIPLQDNIQQFDLFCTEKADFYQQELIYHLGRRLGLYIPKTDYVNVYINYADYGDYTLKQSFDNVFLEQNNIPDAVIFSLGELEGEFYGVHYLNQESFGRKVEEHLGRMPELILNHDPNLLIKYFDVDYLARFQALRYLLNTNPSFVIHDNIRFIYNKVNGKLYPIMDESNIANILSAKDSERLIFLHRQLDQHPLIKERRNIYLKEMAKDFQQIIKEYRQLRSKYENLSSDLYYRLRLYLVSSYYYNHVYRRLRAFRQKGQKTEITTLMNNRSQGYGPIKSPRLQASQAYLDHMLVTANLFLKEHRDMGLTFDPRTGTITMGPGEFELKKTMIVPLCYRFQIQAGTVLRIAPGVSLVSYSPFSVLGTAEKPVIIKALDPEKPFDAVAVIGDGSGGSVVRYLDFSGGSQAFIDGVKHSGGLNFHNIDLEMSHSRIHNNTKDCGLVIKKGYIRLENNTFYNNHSDQLSLDFCDGVVKGNRFYLETDLLQEKADAKGDGISMKGSKIVLQKNRLENLADKGVSVGKHSVALIFDNQFIDNPTAVSTRDYGTALVLNNRLTQNGIAVAAYRRSIILGGGTLYIANNILVRNKRQFSVDKYSRCFRLEQDLQLGTLFLNLLKKNNINEMFDTFEQLKDQYRYKESHPQTFMIGDTPAYVDRENKIILVTLPPGASVVQPIYFTCSQDSARVFLIPKAHGIDSADTVGLEDRATRLRSGVMYNFKNYIFRGDLNYEHGYQIDAYELVVTTGHLPIIEIDTRGDSHKPQEIVNEPKIECSLRFLQTPSILETGTTGDVSYLNHFLQAKIEGRGQKWEKWKYGLTFERPIGPMGMPRSKRWVLESAYVEKSLMRPKLAFQIFDWIRPPETKRIAPRSYFVEVILNGDYRGVYLLMEHVDRDFLNLDDYDKNETHNALLFRAVNKSANFTPLNDPGSLLRKGYEDLDGQVQPWGKAQDPIRGWTSGFEQRHPNPEKYGEHWAPLEAFVRFVIDSNDEDFELNITNYLDMERYIELWIFTQLVDDSDGLYQNRYLVREKGKDAKWYFVPWDKDGTLGRDYKKDKRSWGIWLHTHLFDRCMKLNWFREALKATWQSLIDRKVISVEAIHKLIDDDVIRLLDPQARNFQRWPGDIRKGQYPDDNTFQQEILYLKDWIQHRFEFLNNRMIHIHEQEHR